MDTYYFDSIDSTNVKAKELASLGAVSGTTVWAGYQSEGRGRLGKEWHSVAGNGLYCSVILRPELKIEEISKITLVTGVAVGKLLAELVGKEVQLKWPNDIYFSGKKCVGILAESSPLNIEANERYVVIGIGINVNQSLVDFPAELRSTVTTMYEEAGKKFDLEKLLYALRERLISQVNMFEQHGFAPILAEWRRMDLLLGREMECVDVQGKVVRGVSRGPDSNGNLHVESIDGTLHRVLSGDVRLAAKK